ncbi:hypothetical protein [Arthrobacter sp. NA-172]|uniref:hypothetical protein n=1 Tax=Arthrobacter sp. NA-172 TaxID=3367524 RepID=UPI0037541E0C
MSTAIAIAVMGTALSLNGVFRGWAWLVPAITTVCTVALTLAVLRALRVRPLLTTFGGLVSLVFILAFHVLPPAKHRGLHPLRRNP